MVTVGRSESVMENGKESAGMSDNLFDLGDLDDVLKEFNESTESEGEMDEQMKESQRRYDEYIKKHKEE